MTVRVLTTGADVDALVPEWDALAERLDCPYSSPRWMLAWWEHMRPARAKLAVIEIREGEELVGVGPFFHVPVLPRLAEYRLLAGDISPGAEPLARAGYEEPVASAIAAALAEARPALVTFEGVPGRSAWTGRLARAWPGRMPSVHESRFVSAPFLDLEAQTYEQWLASKSSNFRSQMGKSARRVERAGGELRLAEGEREVREGVDAFIRLHAARWDWRGGSNVIREGLAEMLVDASRSLPGRRFQMWLIRIDGAIVGAQIFVRAGTELTWWLGGFDVEWAKLKPGLITTMRALEEGCAPGDRLDLGSGEADFKDRIASGSELLVWASIVPSGPAGIPGRLVLLPGKIRRFASARLSREAKRRVRRVLSRRS